MSDTKLQVGRTSFLRIDVDAATGRPPAQIKLGDHRVEIRTGQRAVRTRGIGAEVRRAFTKISLPFRSTAFTNARALRHAEWRFDRHVNRLVEDLANKGDRLRPEQIRDRLTRIAKQGEKLERLADGTSPATAERFKLNLQDSLRALAAHAPGKLDQVEELLAEGEAFGRVAGSAPHGRLAPQLRDMLGTLGEVSARGRAASLDNGPLLIADEDEVSDDNSGDAPPTFPTYRAAGVTRSHPEMVGVLSAMFAPAGPPDMADGSAMSKALAGSVVALLNEKGMRTGQSTDRVLADFRRAVVDDRGLSEPFRAKILSVVDAISDDYELGEAAQDVPAFSGFPRGELWRLTINGQEQAEGGRWAREDKEQGYRSGMTAATLRMVDSCAWGRPATAGLVEAFHRDVCANALRAGFGSEHEDFQEALVLKPGFRDGEETNYEGPLSSFSPAGAARLRGKIEAGDDWFEGFTVKPGKAEISLRSASRAECRQRTQELLDRCYDGIRKAGNDDDKLRAIATCCQDLLQSHVFGDGNLRTVKVLLNKLLLDAGLSPAIMHRPENIDGLGIDELVTQIKKGQMAFQSFRDKPEPISLTDEDHRQDVFPEVDPASIGRPRPAADREQAAASRAAHLPAEIAPMMPDGMVFGVEGGKVVGRLHTELTGGPALDAFEEYLVEQTGDYEKQRKNNGDPVSSQFAKDVSRMSRVELGRGPDAVSIARAPDGWDATKEYAGGDEALARNVAVLLTQTALNAVHMGFGSGGLMAADNEPLVVSAPILGEGSLHARVEPHIDEDTGERFHVFTFVNETQVGGVSHASGRMPLASVQGVGELNIDGHESRMQLSVSLRYKEDDLRQGRFDAFEYARPPTQQLRLALAR